MVGLAAFVSRSAVARSMGNRSPSISGAVATGGASIGGALSVGGPRRAGKTGGRVRSGAGGGGRVRSAGVVGVSGTGGSSVCPHAGRIAQKTANRDNEPSEKTLFMARDSVPLRRLLGGRRVNLRPLADVAEAAGDDLLVAVQ